MAGHNPLDEGISLEMPGDWHAWIVYQPHRVLWARPPGDKPDPKMYVCAETVERLRALVVARMVTMGDGGEGERF